MVCKTAIELPSDVVEALQKAKEQEETGSIGEVILSEYLENLHLASERSAPICQDTGFPVFYVNVPKNFAISREELKRHIKDSLKRATEHQYLRPNAVDPVTGINSGINLGAGFPAIYFEEDENKEYIEISLILKGGGSENVSCQYSLPYTPLNAGRDLEGVRRVVLDAVVKAEGKGCPPGILGVCIGGDREGGYKEAKRQFLRRLDDKNSDEILQRLEETLLRDLNSLGIGPQGLGGRSTVLAVKVGRLHRLPACFFVTVSYMCWAMRRRRLVYKGDSEFEII